MARIAGSSLGDAVIIGCWGGPRIKQSSRLQLSLRRRRNMLDHVSLGVRDIRRSRHLYDHALRPLGLVRIVDFGNGRGSDYGVAPGSLGVEFTITREPELRTPIAGAHLCFRAPDREAVRAFHAAAMAAGGSDDGAPGLSAAVPCRLLRRVRTRSGWPSHRGGVP